MDHKTDNKSNPIYISFHEFINIRTDMRKAKDVKKKFFCLFGNPVDVAKEKETLAEKKGLLLEEA